MGREEEADDYKLERLGPKSQSSDFNKPRIAQNAHLTEILHWTCPQSKWAFLGRNLSSAQFIADFPTSVCTQRYCASHANKCIPLTHFEPPDRSFFRPLRPNGPDPRLTFRTRRKKVSLYHTFGSLVLMEGEFSVPSGVDVNSDSGVIVADVNNPPLQVFDHNGHFKFQFGQVGRGEGQMCFPRRVAVDPLGRLVVVECSVMRVIIFHHSGNLLRKLVCSDQLTFPNGVAVNAKEEILIFDNLAQCVKVFNYPGAYLYQIGGEGIANFPVAGVPQCSGEVPGLPCSSRTGPCKAYESNTKQTHCLEAPGGDGGSVLLASRCCAIHMYHFACVPPVLLSPAVFAPLPPRRQWGRSSKTFKPKKSISEGTHQYDLMKQAAATQGSGNLRLAVMLREGEDLNEWVAVDTVDFFNQIHILYGTGDRVLHREQLRRHVGGPQVRVPLGCTELSQPDPLLSLVYFKDQRPAFV
ncbi:hypothetical protein HPB48_016538 [Haemaphysalis longicornis]|uniref:Uncharacterized protein n=1 Tax=Haemaphysalis longicornis TaxID=44386 RepID=A0A9J6GC10_HAELO|nr:hypothetical protein HPB48_016538 [Haemaphysalis longicornis]